MITKNNLTAIILAGGTGSRLRSVTDLPKAIVPIFGKPYLFYVLEALKDDGIKNVIVCSGYRSELLTETIQTWNPGLNLCFSTEPEPFGTGGALRLASGLLQTDYSLVLNGDSFCDFALDPFLELHNLNADKISILAIHVDNCSRYGRLNFGETRRITEFKEKDAADLSGGWINGGIYLLPSKKLSELPARTPLSLEREIFPRWLEEGMFAFPINASFLDIGTPESFAQKETFIAALKDRGRNRSSSTSLPSFKDAL